jgi:alpha-glucosidase
MSFVYNGEEIGMVNGHIPNNMIQDPRAVGSAGRDPERTPLQWSAENNAGFTKAKQPWLPIAQGYEERNVEKENKDQGSFLTLYKELAKIRNKSDALRQGSIEIIKTGNSNVLGFKRAEGKKAHIVLVNFSEEETEARLPDSLNLGRFEISSDATTRHKKTDGNIVRLLPNEAAVFTK